MYLFADRPSDFVGSGLADAVYRLQFARNLYCNMLGNPKTISSQFAQKIQLTQLDEVNQHVCIDQCGLSVAR